MDDDALVILFAMQMNPQELMGCKLRKFKITLQTNLIFDLLLQLIYGGCLAGLEHELMVSIVPTRCRITLLQH